MGGHVAQDIEIAGLTSTARKPNIKSAALKEAMKAIQCAEGAMVWGVNHPPGSNGFYLAGEFEGAAGIASDGWRERLARHFIDQMPAAEQAIFQDENGSGAHWYACHAVNKFSMRPEFFGTVREGADLCIRHHEKPLFYKTSGNVTKLASLAMFSGPVLTVDEPLRSFIEWLEPGVHTFVPIEIRKARGADPIGTRYILVVERRIDSFSEVHSLASSFNISADRLSVTHEEQASAMRHLAFRRERIGDAHLWIEPRFRRYLLCMSDRLRAEIADAGLRIPKHWPMKEV